MGVDHELAGCSLVEVGVSLRCFVEGYDRGGNRLGDLYAVVEDGHQERTGVSVLIKRPTVMWHPSAAKVTTAVARCHEGFTSEKGPGLANPGPFLFPTGRARKTRTRRSLRVMGSRVCNLSSTANGPAALIGWTAGPFRVRPSVSRAR